MKCRERIFALLLAVSLLLGLGVTGLAAAPEGPGPVILMVTGGTALQKFCCYLRSSASPDGCVNIGMSMTSLASALDIGRASLYRCIDALVDGGVIERRDGGFSIAKPDHINNIINGAE